MKKKTLSILMAVTLCAAMVAGCGSKTEAPATTETPAATEEQAPAAETPAATATDFDNTSDISVYSREEGSGTRGAFIELFGVQETNAAGEKVDMTTQEASVTNNTSVMMTSVAGDEYAIGYISLGSLDNSVKALKIDGTEATVENIKSGAYKVARPFNIATKGAPSAEAQDFINYIMSAEGQKIVADNGYITIDDAAPAYEAAGVKGKIVVAGSSSVTPLMEKLVEAYNAVNKDLTIEIQTSDSTTGMTSTIDGVCDIGMASRELKDTETGAGLTPIVIAQDGIAVIVNNSNPMDEMTADQVKGIYVGDTLTWDGIQ